MIDLNTQFCPSKWFSLTLVNCTDLFTSIKSYFIIRLMTAMSYKKTYVFTDI